jgi:hypothetical protein
MRFPLLCIVTSICAPDAAALSAGDAAKPSPIQQDILHCLDDMRPELAAVSAVDLLQDPQTLKEARADLQERMKGRAYTTKIPKG